MTRLLVVGVGPRPSDEVSAVFAPGLRLESMARELARHDHAVEILEYPFGGKDAKIAPAPPGVESLHVLPTGEENAREVLAKRIFDFCPDAVIALTDYVAWLVATSPYVGPLYVDYNGHPMAERQMSAFVHENNAGLFDQWNYVLPVLLRADRFATCSGAQRLALTGELGAAGRLNAATCGTDLVDVLRPPITFEKPFQPSGEKSFLRGQRVPSDARIILFTGGYNTWLDEEMLFDAIERVLERDEKAWYVSTGGRIEGHVSRVFERFESMVKESRHRERYHFTGWLEHRRFVDCCLEADVGVFADRWTLEGELGFRNRIFAWAWAGMRTVATDLCEEVREEFVPLGVVDPVACGDSEGMAKALLAALEKGRLNEEEAARQREALSARCSPGVEYAPLLKWVEAPAAAPDREQGVDFENSLAQAQQTFRRMLGLEPDVQALLTRLGGSRAFRLWAATQPEVRRLLKRLNKGE